MPGAASIGIDTKRSGSATVHASHDSSTTNSRTSAIARAWKVGAEVDVGAKLKGIDVGAKVTAEYGQTVTDTATSSQTDTDRSGSSVTIDLPGTAQVDVEQTIRHQSATVKLNAHVDFNIHMHHKTADSWELQIISLRNVLIPAALGQAPRDQSGGPFSTSTPELWKLFTTPPDGPSGYGPVGQDFADRVGAPLEGIVSFPATWREVLELTVRDRNADPASAGPLKGR